MKKNEMDIQLMYGVNDKPKILMQILLGLQHIFAAFGGIIVVPIVISVALGFDAQTSTALISSAILAAGVATFIQSKGIGLLAHVLHVLWGLILHLLHQLLLLVENLDCQEFLEQQF